MGRRPRSRSACGRAVRAVLRAPGDGSVAGVRYAGSRRRCAFLRSRRDARRPRELAVPDTNGAARQPRLRPRGIRHGLRRGPYRGTGWTRDIHESGSDCAHRSRRGIADAASRRVARHTPGVACAARGTGTPVRGRGWQMSARIDRRDAVGRARCEDGTSRARAARCHCGEPAGDDVTASGGCLTIDRGAPAVDPRCQRRTPVSS